MFRGENIIGLRMTKSDKVLLPPVLVKTEVRRAIEIEAEQRGGGSISAVVREALTDRFGPLANAPRVSV
jgi:hypothetical protein